MLKNLRQQIRSQYNRTKNTAKLNCKQYKQIRNKLNQLQKEHKNITGNYYLEYLHLPGKYIR